jgi:hypothetical protein
MNAEFISRLERSFARDDELQDALGGKDAILFMRAIMAAMKKAGEIGAASLRPTVIITDPPWLTEPYAFNQAVKAANGVMEAFRPPGDPLPPAAPSAAQQGDASKTSLSPGAELAIALTDAVLKRQHSSLEEFREHTLTELERLLSLGYGLVPRAQIEKIEEQKREGEHHSSGKVELASKIRSGRARSGKWEATDPLHDRAGNKETGGGTARPASRRSGERHRR